MTKKIGKLPGNVCIKLNQIKIFLKQEIINEFFSQNNLVRV